MSALAAPRRRTRRRRRRPLSPWGWYALFWCLYSLGLLAWGVAKLAGGVVGSGVCLAGSGAFWFYWWWPRLMRELRRMDDD
jgi:CHASE2 domain-containing sensor protein